MRILLLCAAGVLSIGTSALADVTTTGSYKGVSTESGLTNTYTTNPATGIRNYTIVQGSSVVNGGGEITFSDGAVAAGSGSAADSTSATSTTTISERVTNTAGATKQVDFSSILSNGSFGMFATTPCEAQSQAQCDDTQNLNLGLAHTTGTAASGFNIDVTVNGVAIYTLSGELDLANGVFTPKITDAMSVLNGFFAGDESPRGSELQHFYSWNDTPLNLTLGDLAAGKSLEVAYNLTTFSTTSLNLAQGGGAIGYSAFGDPIGMGHVINAVRIPIFDFAEPQIALIPVQSGAPEPATWTMLMLGVGVAGAAMRQRRLVAAA